MGITVNGEAKRHEVDVRSVELRSRHELFRWRQWRLIRYTVIETDQITSIWRNYIGSNLGFQLSVSVFDE